MRERRRARLVRQVLVESLLVSLGGAVLGLVLAEGGVRVLLRTGPETLPRLDSVAVDWTVALFAALSALASAIIFGLVPALRASRPTLMDVLRTTGRTTAGSGSKWLRDGVVLAEVALAFVLLIGSGLMVRSFIALQSTDPGYSYDNVLAFFAPSGQPRNPDAQRAFLAQMQERLTAIPGVLAVTGSSAVPLDGSAATARWGTEEAAGDANKFQQMTPHYIRDDYFDVMETRLIEGRTFTHEDHNPKLRRVVIDSVIAGKAFPG